MPSHGPRSSEPDAASATASNYGTAEARLLFALTDAEWEQLAIYVTDPASAGSTGRGRPRAADRAAFEAILYIIATGVRWADLPKGRALFEGTSFGGFGLHYATAWRRLKRWERDGTWLRLWPAFVHLRGTAERPFWTDAERSYRERLEERARGVW